MSGPKCNEFELSEQRRQEELRRIEEELRRKQEEERQKRLAEMRRMLEERKARIEYIKEANSRFEEELERQLKEEYEEELQETYAKREQQIIAEAIDEVMDEMGYEVIAESKPMEKVSMPVKAQVFSFSEGVGVQIVEAGERISIEVVGLGTNNRIPTEKEKEHLEDKMEEFCDVFHRFEEKLEEKGIVRARVIHKMPPDKKFARVLNLENFNRIKDVNTLQSVIKKQESGKLHTEESVAQRKTMQKRMN